MGLAHFGDMMTATHLELAGSRRARLRRSLSGFETLTPMRASRSPSP